MASIMANLSTPPLTFISQRQPLLGTLRNYTVPASLVCIVPLSSFITERQGRLDVVLKATGESSESSTSLNVVKSVKNVWDNSEDRIALIGLGFAAVVAIWASTNLITAIDKLPLIPSIFEFVGILFSSCFVYRYLLFKPDREELFRIINKSISDVLGQ